MAMKLAANFTRGNILYANAKKDQSTCLQYILPQFKVEVAKLNEIAGYDAISTNIDHLAWAGSTQESQSPKFIMTHFVRDAMEICHRNFFEFDDFIDYNMDNRNDDQLEHDCDCDFTYHIMAALVLERKIAQAFYYVHIKWKSRCSLGPTS